MANGSFGKLGGAIALAVGMLIGAPAMAENAYDFSFEKIDGGALPLSQFKGKALLIVNTASFCGFTPQYEGLESIYQEYKGKGLVVVGVPANNFGDQEPGTNAEIKAFCRTKYDVDFPLAAKVSVRGDDAHPFYKWAAGFFDEHKVPKWNFHKYLINTNGELVASYGAKVVPDSPKMKAAIDQALSGK